MLGEKINLSTPFKGPAIPQTLSVAVTKVICIQLTGPAHTFFVNETNYFSQGPGA